MSLDGISSGAAVVTLSPIPALRNNVGGGGPIVLEVEKIAAANYSAKKIASSESEHRPVLLPDGQVTRCSGASSVPLVKKVCRGRHPLLVTRTGSSISGSLAAVAWKREDERGLVIFGIGMLHVDVEHAAGDRDVLRTAPTHQSSAGRQGSRQKYL